MKKLHIFFLILIALVFVSVLTLGFILDGREKSNIIKNQIVEIKGENYRQKTLTTFLLMGIDKDYIEQSIGITNQQQCDFVAVVTFDYGNKEYSVLQFNRDSMVKVERLNMGGLRSGDYQVMQLALAHTYGSGLKDSCDNASRCISDLLYGLEIDYYIAFTMQSVRQVLDFVASETGIPVTFDQDYTTIDDEYSEGVS